MPGKLPRQGVYVRLGLSAIDGIGVFAIRPIAEGTDIFASDGVPLVWVGRAELDHSGLSEAEGAPYRHFPIQRGDSLGCPANLNNLTPAGTWTSRRRAAPPTSAPARLRLRRLPRHRRRRGADHRLFRLQRSARS